jgi:hypothetical protein
VAIDGKDLVEKIGGLMRPGRRQDGRIAERLSL